MNLANNQSQGRIRGFGASVRSAVSSAADAAVAGANSEDVIRSVDLTEDPTPQGGNIFFWIQLWHATWSGIGSTPQLLVDCLCSRRHWATASGRGGGEAGAGGEGLTKGVHVCPWVYVWMRVWVWMWMRVRAWVRMWCDMNPGWFENVFICHTVLVRVRILVPWHVSGGISFSLFSCLFVCAREQIEKKGLVPANKTFVPVSVPAPGPALLSPPSCLCPPLQLTRVGHPRVYWQATRLSCVLLPRSTFCPPHRLSSTWDPNSLVGRKA